MSNRAVFWSRERFVTTYLHETAHRILGNAGKADFAHNTVFFSLQLVMFMRMDSANLKVAGGWANYSSFYDLQNPPAALENEPINVWLPRCLAWSMGVARELAEADLTAEECAFELVSRYEKWCATLEKEPQIKAVAVESNRKKSASIQNQISALTAKSIERFWLAGAGWFLFLLSVFGLAFGQGAR